MSSWEKRPNQWHDAVHGSRSYMSDICRTSNTLKFPIWWTCFQLVWTSVVKTSSKLSRCPAVVATMQHCNTGIAKVTIWWALWTSLARAMAVLRRRIDGRSSTSFAM